MARVQQLLTEWKPWLPGHGILLAPHRDVPDVLPDEYDIAEITAQGIGDINGDRYPWVIGIDIVHDQIQLSKAIRWMADHVDDRGHVVVDLPFPQYRPSEIAELFRLVWRGAWFVSMEIKSGRMTVVAREHRLLSEEASAMHFLIDNRPEVGDTYSCIPLYHRLQEEYGQVAVSLRDDPHNLFARLPEVYRYDEAITYDGIIRQQTDRNEYGDFLRRARDFYDYPIALAHELGYLSSPSENVALPQLSFSADDMATWREIKSYSSDAPIVICPSTNYAPRDWPLDRFGRLITWLLEQKERVVVVGRDKVPIPGLEQRITKKRYLDLRGKTTVRQFAFVIASAKLVICPDTAAAHFAQAHEIPVIILQGPTTKAPLFRYSEKVVSLSRRDGGCVNCYQECDPNKRYHEGQQKQLYRCKPKGSLPCMSTITLVSVIDKINQLLGRTPEPPSLSVCLMVKNEEKVIKECIESVEEIADEIVVVDTGCTDRTIEIIQEADTRNIVSVYQDDKRGFEHGQICDYAAARNGTFERATKKYVLWMDAGDRLTEPKALRAAIDRETADVIQMQTLFGEDSYFRERVVPRGLCHWCDRVHETIDIGNLHTIGFTDCAVRHVATEKIGREGSLERNVRLLKRMVEENKPTSPRYGRWCYYLARELKHMGRIAEAIPHYEKAILLCGFYEEKMQSIIDLGRVYMDIRDYTRAIHMAYEGLKVADGWREPYYLAGDAYFWAGEYHRAIPWYLHCTLVPRPSTVLWLWEDLYTWLPYCQLAYCHERIGQFDRAVHFAEKDLALCPEGQKKRAQSHLDDLRKKL